MEPLDPVGVSAGLSENVDDPAVLTATGIRLAYYVAELQNEIALLQDDVRRLRMYLAEDEAQRRRSR